MKFYKHLNSRTPFPDVLELAATASETFKEGEALTMSSGKLTKASGTSAAKYVAIEDKAIPSGGGLLRCIKVDSNMLFECAAAGAVAAGAKYTIHTDGLSITTTTTSGVVEVVVGTSAAGTAIVALA